MYETRSHGFVTINDVTFPAAVYTYGVERSVISLLTDAATEGNTHLLGVRCGNNSVKLT